MKNPCTPDCARRSATCHATCKLQKLYEYAKEKELQQRRQNVQADWDANSGPRKRRAAALRRMKRGRK